MYVWKERDTRTLCATETKSKTPEKPGKTDFRRLFSGGGASAAGSAFPVNRYGVFPLWKIRRIFSILQSHKSHDLLHLCAVAFRQILRYCRQQGFLFFLGKAASLRQCFSIFQKNIQSFQSCFILAFFLSFPDQPQPFLAQRFHLCLCPVHPIPPFV